MIGMVTLFFASMALAAAAPALAQSVPPSPPPQSAETSLPDPDPARLAAATQAADALVPDGVYLRMMRDQFPVMMDAMMSEMMGMKASDFVPGEPEGTMAEIGRTADPDFEERMRIMTRVMGEEMGKLMSEMEPSVRAGLARSFARKFTEPQLADMNRFFATPSGRAFAAEYLASFTDPEMMREIAKATPTIMRAMPDMMKKVEAATAHLPPPPKPTGADAAAQADDAEAETPEGQTE